MIFHILILTLLLNIGWNEKGLLDRITETTLHKEQGFKKMVDKIYREAMTRN